MYHINKKHIIMVIMAMTLSCVGALAQKKRPKPAKKPVTKVETQETLLLMADLMPATAKLVVVDSVVCDKEDFIKFIPLSADCGKLTTPGKLFDTEGKTGGPGLAYINEFGDKCFYSDSTKAGKPLLYSAEKLGGKWQQPRVVDELGSDFENVGYPYLMPDGVTLYFSAINKANSLGGRDIYMTRMNSDSMRFYKPENVGLPYNSAANDYCCIIDDMNQLGWLVTDRLQPKGKVCVYTFVPTNDRWTDGNATMPERKLEALAKLTSIKDTWTDNKTVEDAKNRLAKLKNAIKKNAATVNDISFVVNDRTIYRNIADFKSPTGKEMFANLTKLKKQKQTGDKTLDLMRQQYSKSSAGDRKKAKANILILEEESFSLDRQIKELEKKIRNAENLL